MFRKSADPATQKTRKPRPKKASIRQALLAEKAPVAKSLAQAALDAGYSRSYARSNVYRKQVKARIQERTQERVREARFQTDELVGFLLSIIRSDFSDILDDNPILQQARERGLSHLIKELSVTVNARGQEEYKVKGHDPLAAIAALTKIYGLEKLPMPAVNTEELNRDRVRTIAVERLIARAAEQGVVLTEEEAAAHIDEYFRRVDAERAMGDSIDADA